MSRLLYRDGLMLIIDKPAGLAVHKGPEGRKGGASIEDYFDALRFGLPRMPALAHRLDKETSGCLVLGRLDDKIGWWMKHDPNGLPSQTTWKVMGRAGGFTWLALEPLTGRTHQLRVHCSEMGFPILGDNIYGKAPRHAPGMHLHAREIVVPLYKNKPPIKVTAPVPPHMKERLTACGWDEELDKQVVTPPATARARSGPASQRPA
jgi:tRNA pseudouridine32 synthase/23S rRNA pseudouridine746 synthase